MENDKLLIISEANKQDEVLEAVFGKSMTKFRLNKQVLSFSHWLFRNYYNFYWNYYLTSIVGFGVHSEESGYALNFLIPGILAILIGFG